MKTAAQKESRHCCIGRVCVRQVWQDAVGMQRIFGSLFGSRYSPGLHVKLYRWRIRGATLSFPYLFSPKRSWIFPLECSFPAGSIQTARLTVLTHWSDTLWTVPLCSLGGNTEKAATERIPTVPSCHLGLEIVMCHSFHLWVKWLSPNLEQRNADLCRTVAWQGLRTLWTDLSLSHTLKQKHERLDSNIFHDRDLDSFHDKDVHMFLMELTAFSCFKAWFCWPCL